MTWPTPDTDADVPTTDVSSGSTAGAPASARSSIFLPLITRFNTLKALVNSIINYGAPYLATGGAIGGRAYTTPVSIPYAATINIDMSRSNVFNIGQLTGNITLTASNPADGHTVTIRFIQDATGNRTVTLPSSFAVAGVVNPAASSATLTVSLLTVTYNAASGMYEGAYLWIPS